MLNVLEFWKRRALEYIHFSSRQSLLFYNFQPNMVDSPLLFTLFPPRRSRAPLVLLPCVEATPCVTSLGTGRTRDTIFPIIYKMITSFLPANPVFTPSLPRLPSPSLACWMTLYISLKCCKIVNRCSLYHGYFDVFYDFIGNCGKSKLEIRS